MFEGATMIYFNIILVLSLYISVLQLLNRTSIYVEALLYALVFFPSIVAVVVFLFNKFKGSWQSCRKNALQNPEVMDLDLSKDDAGQHLEDSAVQDRLLITLGMDCFDHVYICYVHVAAIAHFKISSAQTVLFIIHCIRILFLSFIS